MLVKRINLRNIGKFSSLESKEFENKVNIVFGENWSGKTTLSHIFSFFEMESFVPSEEKVTLWENLKQSDDSFVELELGDGNKIRYTHKNKDKGRPIYVFNANFVASHVFDGTKSNAKGFSNVGEIKNDEIVKLEENIRKLRDENNDLESKKKGLDDEFERIKKPTGKEFHEKLPGKQLSFKHIEEYKVPEESLEDLGKEKEKLLKNYELANNQKLGKFLDKIGNINFKSL